MSAASAPPPITIAPHPDRKGHWALTSSLWLPRPRDEVFPFFADAHNLQTLTPPLLRFEILTAAPIAMHAGALIDYRLRVHGVPLRWRTEITRWEPPRRFEDTQVRGPYRTWEHLHTFTERDGGTLCEDRVVYRPPFGVLANALLVRRDLERIFAFRLARMQELFGAARAA